MNVLDTKIDIAIAVALLVVGQLIVNAYPAVSLAVSMTGMFFLYNRQR
jgi:uncharacterized membrane protein